MSIRSLGLGLFLAMFDTSVVATCLFSIGTEFGDLSRINWIALAYTLSYVSCAVLFTRASDVVGRRNAYTAAFIIFFASSIGCGFAHNLDQLIALRTLQGVGGSGLYSLSMVIMPEMARESQKSMIGAIVGTVIAIAGVLGPVVGGLLTNNATWRWVFWIK